MTAKAFTHIVLGAGSAGCILAARLSENPDFRVLLVEAGGSGRHDPMLKVPMMTALLLKGRRHVWRHVTEAEPGLGGRRVDLPRGKVLGGSSTINGMVYARGLPSDYDAWARAGLPDWSWPKVRPYFLRSEEFLGEGRQAAQDAAVSANEAAETGTDHGFDGPLAVSRRARPVSPLADAFVQAGIEAGHPRSRDFNAERPEGFGYYHFTTRSGYRESTATAFLEPAAARPNLSIQTHCEVAKIVFHQGRVRGVELVSGRSVQTIETEGEIILCCGAIGSPAVLLRSGVGPADQLRKHAIEVVADSPNVGENLQDHVLIRVTHASNADVSLHRLTRPDRAVLGFLRALLFGTGPMSVFPLEAGAYIRTGGAALPTLQSHFLPALGSDTVRFNPFARPPVGTGPGFMANASVMRPQSRGRIRLRGRDLTTQLDIRVNYLEDSRDAETLTDAVAALREVFSQPAFDPYRGAELSPGRDIRSRAAILQWVRETAATVHHLCGTCRMGPNDADVLDPQLRLRGVMGLRVADASVFPSIPSTNTAAAAMMVAEKAADLLRPP